MLVPNSDLRLESKSSLAIELLLLMLIFCNHAHVLGKDTAALKLEHVFLRAEVLWPVVLASLVEVLDRENIAHLVDLDDELATEELSAFFKPLLISLVLLLNLLYHLTGNSCFTLLLSTTITWCHLKTRCAIE